jgi:hypothetical protein
MENFVFMCKRDKPHNSSSILTSQRKIAGVDLLTIEVLS